MLDQGGQTRHTLAFSSSLGFCRRGEALSDGAVVCQIPDDEALHGAESSVCGLKAFLIDERRVFNLPSGSITVDCAKVAALDIVDSPVHVHGETVETYHILAGDGRMLLGERVVEVSAGSVIVIPPGTAHGLRANDPQRPLRVLMTFSPGLAPVAHENVRDEQILFPSAAEHIAARDH